ncbi:MAG: adenylyltransferase/cytidyltransferase family protein [Fibrobacteria bacterium]
MVPLAGGRPVKPPGFRHALVIGNFYPPHNGHLHLIETAGTFSDHVTVVVLGIRTKTRSGRGNSKKPPGNPGGLAKSVALRCVGGRREEEAEPRVLPRALDGRRLAWKPPPRISVSKPFRSGISSFFCLRGAELCGRR